MQVQIMTSAFANILDINLTLLPSYFTKTPEAVDCYYFYCNIIQFVVKLI